MQCSEYGGSCGTFGTSVVYLQDRHRQFPQPDSKGRYQGEKSLRSALCLTTYPEYKLICSLAPLPFALQATLLGLLTYIELALELTGFKFNLEPEHNSSLIFNSEWSSSMYRLRKSQNIIEGYNINATVYYYI